MPYCVGRKRHSHLECVCQVLAEDKTSALYSQVRQRLLCLCETHTFGLLCVYRCYLKSVIAMVNLPI